MSDLRQVVLDTETTGLSFEGDRIVEIGCVELVNRRLTNVNYHQYINPEIPMPQGAFDVHGLSDEFLADKPLFEGVYKSFLEYIKGSQVIIHNASFDVGFLDAELQRVSPSIGKMADYCEIIDSLALARELHPGQRNTLDALAQRYTIDNSHRKLHGALLDSEILADVYLMMSGGQSALSLEEKRDNSKEGNNQFSIDMSTLSLPVVAASESEIDAHQEIITDIEKQNSESSLWTQYNHSVEQVEN